MDARIIRAAILAAAATSLGASHRTPNFVVEAPTPELAQEIGQAAEKFRTDLAVEWLGKPMPNWGQPCPIKAKVDPRLGAGGATSFMFDRGQNGPEVFGWEMSIQGSRERVLDSVLPHEITHTVFATHFRQPLPRWADEGACTTVEHASERLKQQKMLIEFLQTRRGIAFSRMFAMKDYPRDVMPLYSQGFSLARFLIQQGGKRKFVNYIGDGLKTQDWIAVTNKHYGYSDLAMLQDRWLAWVRQGSPELPSQDQLASVHQVSHTEPAADTTTFRGQDPGASSQADVELPSQQTPVGMQSATTGSNPTAVATLPSPNRAPSTPATSPAAGSTSIYRQGPRGASVPTTPIGQSSPAPSAGPTHSLSAKPENNVLLEWRRPEAAEVVLR